ncbi:CPBP family intramembrane glutamic endopeptidase [Salinimicrobium flavum]|uniref:CPBP family intramembrane glutamic endopeptidase n=1 Tax=Salinimicrobium flavum TaxID=1737065 RepID=A0ABW5ITP3_9FLAO
MKYNRRVEPQTLPLDQQGILGLSLMLLLAINFTINYLLFTYYSDSITSVTGTGFWMLIANNALMAAIVYINKQEMNWSWEDLGLAKPTSWWKPLLITIALFLTLVLFTRYVQPLWADLINTNAISMLDDIQGDLSKLIISLIILWITAGFLEELIFRAFLINALEQFLGNSTWSLWGAVGISSVIFGLIHAYQGIGGILTTTGLGLIFGIAYVINGRRIWPLIFIHGLIDTITMINIYNS